MARELNRSEDLTILEWPVVERIMQFNVADFSGLQTGRQMIHKHLAEGGYDALFCLQEEFLDYVLVETDLLREFPSLQLASMTAPVLNTRSRKYTQSGVARWIMDFPRMISTAADLLQEWVLIRNCPKEIVKMDIPPKP